MSKKPDMITDERLESLLQTYHKAEPDHIPEFDWRAAKSSPAFGKRAIIAAAGVVIAAAVGVAAFTLFNSPAVRTAPASAAFSETYPSFTEGAGELVPTGSPSASGETQKSDASAPTSAIPATAAAASQSGGISGSSGSSVSSRIGGASTTPTQAQESTEIDDAPAVQPKTEPVAEHTEQPTAAPEILPEETLPQSPTYFEPDIAQTAEWRNYLAFQTISATIQKSMLTGEGRVYFRIFAFDGTPLGDSELLSDGNLASVEDYMYDTVTALYYLGKLDNDLEKIRQGDCLTYSFYNEDGEVVCSRIKIF